jgi:hypothetical protein
MRVLPSRVSSLPTGSDVLEPRGTSKKSGWFAGAPRLLALSSKTSGAPDAGCASGDFDLRCSQGRVTQPLLVGGRVAQPLFVGGPSFAGLIFAKGGESDFALFPIWNSVHSKRHSNRFGNEFPTNFHIILLTFVYCCANMVHEPCTRHPRAVPPRDPCVFYHLQTPVAPKYLCSLSLTRNRQNAPKIPLCFLSLTDTQTCKYLCSLSLTKKDGGGGGAIPAESS